MSRGGEDYFFHEDDLGSIVDVTDGSGNVVERYEYTDFGDPKILDLNYDPVAGNESAIGNPYLFTGRRYDPETGLYWYRTRYYDPVGGRFTSRDSIGIWGDPLSLGNGLAYVGNIPTRWTDPYGRGPIDWVLTGMWNPPPGIRDAAADEFARSNHDRSLGTADAVVSNASQGFVHSVGGQAFDESNRQAASETAGTIITTAQTVADVSSLARHVATKGFRASVGMADNFADDFVREADDVVEAVGGAERRAGREAAERAETTVTSGKSRAPKNGGPNSIHEQLDDAGNVRSRTFYDENGHPFSRQDFDHSHGGVRPHEHLREFDSQGRPIRKHTVRPLPSGYDSCPNH